MIRSGMAGEAALAHVHALASQGHRVLDVDGFRVVPEGYMASLDLILDLSLAPMPIEEAVSRANAFIADHAAEDVLFEVVSGGS